MLQKWIFNYQLQEHEQWIHGEAIIDNEYKNSEFYSKVPYSKTIKEDDNIQCKLTMNVNDSSFESLVAFYETQVLAPIQWIEDLYTYHQGFSMEIPWKIAKEESNESEKDINVLDLTKIITEFNISRDKLLDSVSKSLKILKKLNTELIS